ncbi:MAG: hypothetical protein ABI444_00415 [Candidatus Kapaibacterium sp.]|jgi:hypothetical protein
MTPNENILQFLDGSLSQEDEAELLHRLSVSPERRALLRSFLKQEALFARDRNSIAVPYELEQKLWERLTPLLPPAGLPVATTAMVAAETVAESSSIWSRILTPVVGSIAALTLILGIGVGYTLGSGTTHEVTYYTSAPNGQSAIAALSETTDPTPNASGVRYVNQNRANGSANSVGNNRNAGFISGFATSFLSWMNGLAFSNAAAPAQRFVANDEPAQVSSIDQATLAGDQNSILQVTPRMPYMIPAKVGGDDKIRPLFAHADPTMSREKTLLERFEFSFSESFGKQYPNSAATNISLPVVTNSSVSAFFQVFPNSNALWVGASGGTANVTKKHLFTKAGNPLDPLQQELTGEYTHVQSNWVGGLLQYRLGLFPQSDMTFTGGYGISTAGKLAMAEIGLHYDATRDVGFVIGLRGTQITYDLTQERDDAMKAAKGPLVVPRSVSDATPSFNVELNTGLFFHF